MDGEYYHPDINSYLFKNYISYDRLYPMTMEAFYGATNVRAINIFIDIQSMVRDLFSYREFTYKDPGLAIASSLINLGIHLKYYFYSRHSIDSRVYLVWGENYPPYRVNDSYNAHWIQAFNAKINMQKNVLLGLKNLELLSPYLPQIYFVDGGENETAATIMTLVRNGDNTALFSNCPNVIYSKDPYSYQLVSDLPYTFLYRPKKSRSGDGRIADVSWSVTKTNLYDRYRLENGYAKRNILDPDPMYFPMILSMAGMKARHIRGAITFNTGIKVINAVSDKVSPVTPLELVEDIIFDAALTNSNLKGIKINGLREMQQAIDVRVHSAYIEHSNLFPELFKGIQDLYSPRDVKEINDKFFYDYPLDLMRL